MIAERVDVTLRLDVVRMYDRAEFQRVLAVWEAERDRLRERVAAARQRVDKAEALGGGPSATLQARVAALLLDAQELVEDHRAGYALTLDTIARCADEKAERILKMARAEADALRGGGSSWALVSGADASGAAEVLEFAAEGRRIRAARMSPDFGPPWRAADAGAPAS